MCYVNLIYVCLIYLKCSFGCSDYHLIHFYHLLLFLFYLTVSPKFVNVQYYYLCWNILLSCCFVNCVSCYSSAFVIFLLLKLLLWFIYMCLMDHGLPMQIQNHLLLFIFNCEYCWRHLFLLLYVEFDHMIVQALLIASFFLI